MDSLYIRFWRYGPSKSWWGNECLVKKKSSKIILLGVLSVMAALLYFFFSPEKFDSFFPKCPIYQTLGIYCTGCGSQRALHDLFHLRIAEAVSHNLLLIPSLLLIGYHAVVKAFYPTKKSFLEKRKAPVIILGALILFTILRNLALEPFHYLAP